MKGFANVGDVVGGKYRVDKILGIGGMGMVVQAVNLDLDQKVALKLMLPQALESTEAAARFVREARAAGRLTGEHICRVTDIGRFSSGAPYIVMEYLEGYDLMTLLKRRGPLPIHEAVDYILQACEGMAEAHAVGIIHRDLKPDNLFLATRVDGSRIIKVLDFGISKAAVTGLATRTGDVLGSPAYMAPEQMQSTKTVDARADVWSLGVVLHQLISGKLAFHGETLPQLCMAVMNDAPKRLTELRADVPPPLADAVLQCLEKDREQRPADVSVLAEAIAPFGGASADAAVTRVRSLLRGRATPQTLPPSADELAAGDGDVLPTLVGESMPRIPSDRDTPVMRPLPGMATEAARGTTTLASSAGQSMEMRRPRVPLGVIGAVAGTLGMVAVIVVMVMRRDANDDRPATAPPPPPAPTFEPIVEPSPPAATAADGARAPAAPAAASDGARAPAAPAAASDPPRPGIASDGTPAAADGAATSPAASADDRKRRERADDKRGDHRVEDKRGDQREDQRAAVPADAGAAPPPSVDAGEVDDWGRMLGDEPPPRKAP